MHDGAQGADGANEVDDSWYARVEMTPANWVVAKT